MIGRFASLACSNSVYITSYYNSIAYHYIMVKSENTIVTNLVNEIPTTEKNGVEISIVGIDNKQKYEDALRYITFFPNVYIDGVSTMSRYNNAKIRHFNSFSAASIQVRSKLLFGNVLYPIEKIHFNREVRSFLDSIEDSGIVIKFNIGELSVTPNRESIIYNNTTIAKIESRILEAKEELDTLISNKIAKDYIDIVEYYKKAYVSFFYDPISDVILEKDPYNCATYRTGVEDLKNAKLTFRGFDLTDSIRYIRVMLMLQVINFKGTIYDHAILNGKKRVPYRVKDRDTLMYSKFIILKENTKLSPILKSYLYNNYNDFTVLTDFSLSDLDSYITSELKGGVPKFTNWNVVIKGLYDRVKNNAVYLDINTDKDFLKFKEQYKLQKSSFTVKDDKKESILYIFDSLKGYRRKEVFQSLSEMVLYIKRLKCGILLENMQTSEEVCNAVASTRGFTVIKANKDTVNYLRELNLSCVVDLQYLLKKDKFISKIHTIIKYFPSGIFSNSTMSSYNFDAMCSVIKDSLREQFRDLSNSYYKCKYLYLQMAKNEDIPIDEYTEYLCKQLQKYITKYSKIFEMVESSSLGQSIVLITAMAIKTKSSLVSPARYNLYKNNKLFKVLCKK